MGDATVLHVDEPDEVGEQLRAALVSSTEFDVRGCRTVEEAEKALRETDVDCLVAACTLPDGDGADLVPLAREHHPDAGCVLYGEGRPSLDSGPSEQCLTEFVPADCESAIDRVVALVEVTVRHRTQTSYPVPEAEQERLAALDRYDLEDEDALPALQDVVEHAAEELDVRQATINVVGNDEQQFAVCTDEDWPPMPRQSSICTYTILDGEPTVIDDLARDPRFADNDVIDAVGVRSYAGAPIEPEPQRPIAAICVYGEQPGRFDSSDAAYLQTLARDAAAVIASTATDEVSQR